MALNRDIYENLRYRIITNELGAGRQLYEKALMQEYRIGRTPLREIFQELQRNGLIEIIPKLGTRVATLDLRTLRETIQLRRELEGLAAELAARHIEPAQVENLQRLLESAARVKDNSAAALQKLSDLDMEFHQIIYQASGNRQLKQMIESLLYKMSMYWFQVGFSAAEFREQFDELEELLLAVGNRNDKGARNVMKRHIDHFTRLIKEKMFS
ncbi:MAG: GntR family transcriptional regulator [Deltaproteobacteria bacterium]|nr:GntR family transcriptional regulator [Deltaproteobacteria bacterium]MBW2176139.1 GntR family transcriptional regulator [Deltaproteobacteria bacterium]MBW2298408.1 GntR family transcriptional regulator [Deltaproteobacteria bacterium]MBW2613483.1 GntR family transcriptional regulator [Deltaproteobacteria bacterium]